jgi:HK97 family phage portal protein
LNILGLDIKRFHSSASTKAATARPSADDDSAWSPSGGDPWGSSPYLSLTLPAYQVLANRSWVYICVRYNSLNVAAQTLRLYTMVPAATDPNASAVSSAVSKMFAPQTRKISKAQKANLYGKGHLDHFLRKAMEVEEIVEDPWLDMMWKVNPIMNAADMWMLTETYMGLTGNAFWRFRKSAAGGAYQIWPLATPNVYIVPGETLDEPIKLYRFMGSRGAIEYQPDEVLQHKYPNPKSLLWGMAPLEGLSDAVYANMMMWRYDHTMFRNEARPPGVIEAKDLLNDPEYRRMQREWKKSQGPSNVGNIPILDGGMQFKATGLSPKDLMHPQGKRLTREEICDGLGVFPQLLTPEGVNLANAKVAFAQYRRDTVKPKLSLYEQKINEFFSMWPGWENKFVAFDECVPADTEARLKEIEVKLRTRYSFVNEMREGDGLAPVPWGDKPNEPASPFGGGGSIQPGSTTQPGDGTNPGDGGGDGTEPLAAMIVSGVMAGLDLNPKVEK